LRGIRSALILMTGEKYVSLFISFALITITARLVTPEEFGIHIVGNSLAIIAWTTAREFATSHYLVQRPDLSPNDTRSAATIMVLLTALVAMALLAAGPWIAAAYGHQGLILYLQVVAAAFIVEVFSDPLRALMNRDMAFREVAAVNVIGAAVGAAGTIGFAALGFSYMSFAWGWLLSAIAKTITALYFRPYFWVFWPKVSHWQDIVTFSSYNGAHVLLYQLYDRVPYLFFGRLISVEAAGLYNRAITLCRLPDQVFLGGLLAVAVPAFSNEVRGGRNIAAPYLKAIEFVTAVQWPALVLLSILAYPAVSILLGSQWTGVAPLVQIMALAWLFSFSATLNYPVLVALGHMRDVFIRGLIIWPLSTAILAGAAHFGLMAAAFSMLIVMQFQAAVSLQIIRRRLGLEWAEIFRALSKSAIVTLSSAVGPLAVVALAGFRFDISILTALIAGVLAVAGWALGLWWTRHPMRDEASYAWRHMIRSPIGAWAVRLAGRG